MELIIPELSVVVLIGVSSAGKSTFAKQFFKKTEIISSDYCRGLVSDDENDLTVTNDAFDLVHYIAAKRLKNKRTVVIDATNVQPDGRKSLLQLARDYHAIPVAIVLDLSMRTLKDRHKDRTDRNFNHRVLAMQQSQLRRSAHSLRKEGFRYIYTLKSEKQVSEVSINRTKLWNNKQEELAPFDIIGDVHGCFDELKLLLEKLGYTVQKVEQDDDYSFQVSPPEGRRAVFVGDLVDRGPNSPDVLRLVMQMVADGSAFCVCGNHDDKLLRKLKGKKVKLKHGLAETMEQLEKESKSFTDRVQAFLKSLISHYVLDEGKLVVAHAGLREEMQGRASGAVHAFCMYGETTGEIDEFGLPVRYNWAAEYRGQAMVVYGHTPIPDPEWLNHTINIDTGCVFGGKLTALRYPKREIVSVDALKVHSEPVRPLVNNLPEQFNAQQIYDDLLDLADVSGKRIVPTKYRHNITLREENSIAALEVMSRFAINPKWLIYLPPTMSPTKTSELPDFLEHPAEAFSYYKENEVLEVICEEKHMGSRAVVVLCKTPETAQKRFGLLQPSWGVCYTRTGRSFFPNSKDEQALLERLQKALTKTGFWDKFHTDWVCLDCELMPWSEKAQALVRGQYAAVGAAATHNLSAVQQKLQMAQDRGLEVSSLQQIYKEKEELNDKYKASFRNYCREVKSLEDWTLAPFHILATEDNVHVDKTHKWHMENIAEFCKGDEQILMATPYRIVDLYNEQSVADAIAWWEEMTGKGGEGMVVKPKDYVAKTASGIIQPAIKCRGAEYLRIIYGADYNLPKNLAKLKKRSVGKKRSLALREFALGLEALERFVRREPLRRTHECVFGVLALESEEVDPTL